MNGSLSLGAASYVELTEAYVEKPGVYLGLWGASRSIVIIAKNNTQICTSLTEK
jgi:hypothetical protein